MLKAIDNLIDSTCISIWKHTVTFREQQFLNTPVNSPHQVSFSKRVWYIAKAIVIRSILPIIAWAFIVGLVAAVGLCVILLGVIE